MPEENSDSIQEPYYIWVSPLIKVFYIIGCNIFIVNHMQESIRNYFFYASVWQQEKDLIFRNKDSHFT
jgi:hypothetical protein